MFVNTGFENVPDKTCRKRTARISALRTKCIAFSHLSHQISNTSHPTHVTSHTRHTSHTSLTGTSLNLNKITISGKLASWLPTIWNVSKMIGTMNVSIDSSAFDVTPSYCPPLVAETCRILSSYIRETSITGTCRCGKWATINVSLCALDRLWSVYVPFSFSRITVLGSKYS